jgi:hypothetical protein
VKTDAFASGMPMTSRVRHPGQRLLPIASGREHFGQSNTVWPISPIAMVSSGGGRTGSGGGAAARRRARRAALTVIEVELLALDAVGSGAVR